MKTEGAVICNHCNRQALLTNGADLYPHRSDLAAKYFWQCVPCDAMVGCHPPGNGDGTKPLGTLAKVELRRARTQAHRAFDAIWNGGGLGRRAAYAWLAREVGVTVEQCHIGMFDAAQCEVVKRAVASRSWRPKSEVDPELHIYTDGSVYPNPGDGGWAFVVYEDGQVTHEASGGDRETTNNRMEMLAIIKALEWAAGRRCEIFSDSQLCVNTLTTWAEAWQRRGWRKADGGEPLNIDLVKWAYPLYVASSAGIKWVRGHVGNVGNERADDH